MTTEPAEWTTCRQEQLEALSLSSVYAVETEDITNGEIHPTYAYEEIGRRAAEIADSIIDTAPSDLWPVLDK